MIVCGSIAGIWSFAANRFRYDEMFLIVIAGVAIGYGIGLVINGLLIKLEWKDYMKKEDISKTLKKIK